ncbi:inner membrane protein YpjD [Caenispirillum salinarum]|uniref:cytochrome C assembly family protein n=1 Tax=Caenispirillum salinarum TaxID=859058 RepID=UPI00384F88FD
MIPGFLLDLGAVLSLVPLAVVNGRPKAGRDGPFWVAAALAVAGPAVHAASQVVGPWNTGFAMAIWVAVAVSMALFLLLTIASRRAWRLAPLLAPYMIGLSLLAVVWRWAAGPQLAAPVPDAWVELHIGVSVVTYGLLTLSAVAALAAFLQERALKRKKRNALTAILPPVMDSEGLQVRLLAATEVVLGLGLATGMAVQYLETAQLIQVSHKTTLSILAFVVIGGLLLGQRLWGLRGRAAARVVLVAYLLLTLAYPGVKFVTDVLLA